MLIKLTFEFKFTYKGIKLKLEVSNGYNFKGRKRIYKN